MSASSSITNHPQKTGELDWAILNATLALVAGKNASNTLRVVPAQQLSDSVMSGPESPMIATSKASTHQTEPQSKLRRSASPPRQDASVQDAQNALQTLFHSEYVVMGDLLRGGRHNSDRLRARAVWKPLARAAARQMQPVLEAYGACEATTPSLSVSGVAMRSG
ncbi:uncharacterized protein PITG_15555 [Phytophthora infestans T30-4]|uniref:Uncharacterized protein n=1 Tax=Phytophthora infestans (strain T30-4) TaxID=403677 RepID=D0NT26_PHYIT|nr:uncharacterized protein PITG_15555 [Phytophthora infestans T30-4]EEY64782.1 hypothetical protein PITG_15555 [Phytophthora infestans T30-4]|eukprot:XP_002897709.1 hypothetical protein PITG_15555 [Phytophthora infestans T30-4]